MALSGEAKRAVKIALGNSRLGEAVCDAIDASELGSVETIEFDGATGANEIQIPDNLLDALSITGGGSDFLVFRTSNGAELIIVSQTLAMAEGEDISVGTTTGTKIGTSTSQKLGFFNATPVAQRSAITAPTGGATVDAEARTAINAIITALETLGLVAPN